MISHAEGTSLSKNGIRTALIGTSIDELFDAFRAGDADARQSIMSLVYEDLRKRAHQRLRKPGAAITLRTTELVNETCIHLLGVHGSRCVNGRHLMALAAKVMHTIVIDYARRHYTQKRGSGIRPELLDTEEIAIESCAGELLLLDSALTELERRNPRLSKVIELRFFAGLSVEQAAEVLEVTARTIKRDWRTARAFLLQNMMSDTCP